MKLIERSNYLDKIKNVIGTPDIKVITGVRRSGKSKLLEAFRDYVQMNIADANVIHINFNLTQFEDLQEYHALNDYIEKSKKIYADISSDLLISIFFPNNPLHDGGVIIQGDKITSAGAVFPTSDNMRISKRLGTRHRAALGISEEMDCISLIVSEETGRLSIAIGGELHYNLTVDEVKLMLLEELRPKKAVLIEEEEEEEENEEHVESNN